MHQLCQLDGLGCSNPVFSTLNLGYDEPKRRKFAVFSECLRLIAGSIAPVLWIPKAAHARKPSSDYAAAVLRFRWICSRSAALPSTRQT